MFGKIIKLFSVLALLATALGLLYACVCATGVLAQANLPFSKELAEAGAENERLAVLLGILATLALALTYATFGGKEIPKYQYRGDPPPRL